MANDKKHRGMNKPSRNLDQERNLEEQRQPGGAPRPMSDAERGVGDENLGINAPRGE